MPGFETILDGLDALETRLIQAMHDHIADELSAVAQDARSTDVHGDVTGATRAGYYADVGGAGTQTTPFAGRGLAEVAARNPGHALSETLAPGDALVVVISSPTDYQADLSTRRAGVQDALEPTLNHAAPRLHDAAMNGVRQVLA